MENAVNMFTHRSLLLLTLILIDITRVSGQDHEALPLAEDKSCHLHPFDPNTRGIIARHQKAGQLLMVKLELWDGQEEETEDDEDDDEEEDKVFTEQYVTRPGDNFGPMTLALLEELPALSRLALPLFTEELGLLVVDSPHGCIREANHSVRAESARDVLLEDFSVHRPPGEGCIEKQHAVCRLYQLDEVGWWEYPEYDVECCTNGPEDAPSPSCVREESSRLVRWMRWLLCLAKLCLYLVAPALLARAFSSHSEHFQCEVMMATPISKTLLVKSTKVPQVHREDMGGKSLQEPFSRLKESIKTVITGKILNMSIDKVCVSADKSRLVGVSSFSSDIMGYSFTKRQKESVVAGGESVESEGGCCQTSFSVVLGITLAVALISVPFYARVVALCYLDEHLEDVAGDDEYVGSYVWMVLAAVHAAFILTLLLLLLAHRVDRKLTDTVFFGAFRDLRTVSRRAVATMICDNLKLPFKKFGRYGIVVAILYWIFSLPLCFLFSLIYAIPSIYIFGRFIVYKRPKMLRKKMKVLSSRDAEMAACCCRTSTGTTLEHYLQLQKISPGGMDQPMTTIGFFRGILAFFIGLVCVAHLACLLIILGEILSLIGELLIYTTFYLFAHADKMISYIVLFPGLGVYVCYLYKTERDYYTEYKSRLFSVFDSLVEKVVQDYKGGYEGASLGRLGEANCAFYLPDFVLRDILGQERVATPSSQFVGRVDQQLHWCTTGLVYFIAKDKTRYASAELLERVGSLRGPGYNPRRHITRRLCCLVLMLAYVSLGSLVFAYVSELDGSRGASHVMLTLAFYGLPLVAFHVAGSKRPQMDVLNMKQTVCLAGQQHTDRWLVCDLSFPTPRSPRAPSTPHTSPHGVARAPGAGENEEGGANNYSQDESQETRPSYVDFVFCVGVDEEERTEERGPECNREEFVMLPV